MPGVGMINVPDRRFPKQKFDLAFGHSYFELCYRPAIDSVTLRNIYSVDTGRQ